MPEPVCDDLRLQDDSVKLKWLYFLEQKVAAKVPIVSAKKASSFSRHWRGILERYITAIIYLVFQIITPITNSAREVI